MKHFIATLFIVICTITTAQNPAKIIAYKPAPGQFINTLPASSSEDTEETMIKKANESVLVSLGAYGGYVIVKFTYPVINEEGEYDLYIQGNAATNSAEPGIVMVSADDNSNGIADDTWYELAGSEYENSTKNYTITYYKPDENTPDEKHIRWKDNMGGSGYIPKNASHQQCYYPSWEKSDSIVLTGNRLPDNAINAGTEEKPYYQMRSYEWGYADNHSNKDKEKCSFKLEWAVDSEGNKVELKQIDFVKIYTGVNQVNGWTGECSTEYRSIEDLHAKEITPVMNHTESKIEIIQYARTIHISTEENACLYIYNINGNCVYRKEVNNGKSEIELSNLTNGVYIVKVVNSKDCKTAKIVIK